MKTNLKLTPGVPVRRPLGVHIITPGIREAAMGALIPLALTLAPEIARWLSGDSAEKITNAVTQAVQTATGASDPATASAILQQDPVASGQLRIQLAQIAAEQERATRASELLSFKASLTDATDARSQTVALSAQKSAIAWSAPVISGIVLATFATVMALVLLHGVPGGSETMANMLLGTLSAMATSVVSYWVGSSAGSARKEEQIAQTVRAVTAN